MDDLSAVNYALDGLNHGDYLIGYELSLNDLREKSRNGSDLADIAEASKQVSIYAEMISNYFADIAKYPHLANLNYRAVV